MRSAKAPRTLSVVRSDMKLLAAKRPASDTGIVAMVRQAAKRDNRLATAIGALFGGFVPIASFALVHGELGSDWYLDPKSALVAGGLLYSAKTVVQWAQLAFRDKAKAIGFAVLVEGVMTFSATSWLSYAALALLVSINAVATGVTLSRGGK